jgi:glutathione S-transferase
MTEKRLCELQRGLGQREWLVADEFTVADLTTSSALKIAKSLGGALTLFA